MLIWKKYYFRANKVMCPSVKLVENSLTQKTVRSGAWLYGRSIFTNIINVGVMAILARQLLPSDFGLLALAQVLLRFLAIIGTSGIGEYIIYDRSSGHEKRAHAAFWLNLALSLGVTIMGLALTPLITSFYTEHGLKMVLVILLIRYPLEQLSNVPDALVKKTLDYQTLAIRDTLLEIATSLGMVGMVLAGFGVWGLVIPGLVIAPLRFGLIMRMASWSPKLPLQIESWKNIFKFSANVMVSALGSSISAEGDTLIIGKLLGTNQLGLYNMAWQSANIVSRTVTGVVGKMAMPALSTVADNRLRLQSAYNRMFRVLGTISFPLLVGMFIVADLFILTLYGSQWQASILPLQILLIYAMRQSVGSPASVIYNVVGRPDIGMKFSLGFIPFYLVSIWLGSFYGIVGVAAGVTLARTLGGVVAFWIGAKLVEEDLFILLREIFYPFSASLIMGVGVWGARVVIGYFQLTQIEQLVILSGIGGVIYLVLLASLYRKLLAELISIIEVISRPLAVFARRLFRFPESSGVL